jgi:hypothetical protein
MVRATSYSACIVAAARGVPQRGVIHSVFRAAANVLFAQDFVLSLNAATSPRMPNGLQLSSAAEDWPFSALRVGMPVLFGAQRLHIEAVHCSLDLTNCSQWDPHIERPAELNMRIVVNNLRYLQQHLSQQHPQGDFHWRGYEGQGDREREGDCKGQGEREDQGGGEGQGDREREGDRKGRPYDTALSERDWQAWRDAYASPEILRAMAQYLSGRGIGLTPAGDDMLAGWMACNWLLYGPTTRLLEACQQILLVARQQTHLLSQCWLSYAAEGNIALPMRDLLAALTQERQEPLLAAVQDVLALGATSGYDFMQGMLLAATSASID